MIDDGIVVFKFEFVTGMIYITSEMSSIMCPNLRLIWSNPPQVRVNKWRDCEAARTLVSPLPLLLLVTGSMDHQD